MHDVLVLAVAGPRHVVLPRLERHPDRVDTGHELSVGAEHLERGAAHPGHRAHADRDVGRVGQLDADVRERRAEGPHAEGHDVHRATAHAAAEQAVELGAHLGRRLPVVGGPGVDLTLGADEGAVLDPGDVAGVGMGPIGAGTLVRVEGDERARFDQLLAEQLVLGVGPVEPVDVIGLAEPNHLVDPLEESGVTGGGGLHERHVELLQEMQRSRARRAGRRSGIDH